jgi:hypothetical protein
MQAPQSLEALALFIDVQPGLVQDLVQCMFNDPA